MEYIYNCDKCGKRYTEIRATDESQFFFVCDICGGTYTEVQE